MDATNRQISKIAREATRFTGKVLKDSGIGLAEYEFIHCVRHHPGISQEGIRAELNLDKAAVARRAVNLERKGFLLRQQDPSDGRSKQLYVTAKGDAVKNARASVESFFYEWLLADLTAVEKESFLPVLDRLYWKSKNERRIGFGNLLALEAKEHGSSEA
ncbi:MAG: MarR family transcriptional regulator [Negativicutes bacterium]|nr:MarR family transcriptional regulator [Negativicutes bacterium]